MPLTKSAKKALRVSVANKLNNDLTKAKIKSAVKGVKLGIIQKKENVGELLSKAYRELDIAAKKNVIHKNKASRLKSRLTKALSKEQIILKVTKKKSTKKKVAAKKK